MSATAATPTDRARVSDRPARGTRRADGSAFLYLLAPLCGMMGFGVIALAACAPH